MGQLGGSSSKASAQRLTDKNVRHFIVSGNHAHYCISGVGPAPRRAFENAEAFELRRHAENGEDDLGEVGCGVEERFGQ
jgi:hypothetical protein